MDIPVPRMNPSQARAWIALLATAHLLPTVLDERLTRDAGITNFEYGILSALNVAPTQSLRVGELAERLAAPMPRISKAVGRLQGRGLVERGSDPDDGRATQVALTRTGRRAWLTATPPHIALARDTIVGALTPAQQVQLAELLERVLSAVDPSCPAGATG